MGRAQVLPGCHRYAYCNECLFVRVHIGHSFLVIFRWQFQLEDGEAQPQTPSLDKRETLCCGNAATTFRKPPLTLEAAALLEDV